MAKKEKKKPEQKTQIVMVKEPKKKASSSKSSTRLKKEKKSKRHHRRIGSGGTKSFIIDSLAIVGTIIGGSFLLNKLPPTINPKIIGAAAAAGGAFLGLKAKKPIMKSLATGLFALGGLTLIKQFAPKTQIVAGEYNLLGSSDEQLLRYNGDFQSVGEDYSGEDYSGEDYSGEDYSGESYENSGVDWKA